MERADHKIDKNVYDIAIKYIKESFANSVIQPLLSLI